MGAISIGEKDGRDTTELILYFILVLFFSFDTAIVRGNKVASPTFTEKLVTESRWTGFVFSFRRQKLGIGSATSCITCTKSSQVSFSDSECHLGNDYLLKAQKPLVYVITMQALQNCLGGMIKPTVPCSSHVTSPFFYCIRT